MLKRSVDKGVVVGPRQYVVHSHIKSFNNVIVCSVIQCVEKATNVSIGSLLDVMEMGKILKYRDLGISFCTVRGIGRK